MRVLRASVPLALALASPAAALAASTGGQAAPATSSTPPQVRSVARPSGPVNPDFQLAAPSVSFVGTKLRVAGVLRHGARRAVHVQYRTLGGAWTQAAAVRAAGDGRFAATWIPRSPGAYEMRAVARTSRTRTSGLRSVSVFKGQTATWYGPGMYGKSTACGVTLSQDTLGVAHRSLPCGTLVFVSYGGRGVVVPVIDRGPYTKSAQWDLTGATARAIGMTQTSRIGVIVGNPTW
jgi:hypothetical protein